MERTPFDLDELFRLAREEPEKFEVVRKQLIDEAIKTSSPENIPKLEGMQWLIDSERRVFRGDQMQFVNDVFGRMWTSFLDLNDHLRGFRCPAPKQSKPRLVLLRTEKED